MYLALAQAIADGIDRGALAAGQQLPTQRELADRLGIALTTVTRGYREAERRGLVRGEVGRGTFVRGAPPAEPAAEDTTMARVVDLRPNTMVPWPLMPELQRSMAGLILSQAGTELFDYGPHAGAVRHREAGAGWMDRVGLAADAQRVAVSNGAQHAMLVAFAVLAVPGDAVLVEDVTYAGMKSLARLLGLTLVPVAMDREGLLPDALASAARARSARVLYTMPTLQNPTAAVMSERRRHDVAGVVNELGITVVEDDTYGYLLPGPDRLAALCERSYYITGTSKSLLPALRTAFLLSPAEMVERVDATIAASTYLASPLCAGVVARWIHDGTAERVMRWKRDEARARQAIARARLADWRYEAHGDSPHGWLHVPEPWRARDVTARAAERGVLVSPADLFAAGRDHVPHAVRICVGPARTRGDLEHGLTTLAEVLRAGPEPVEMLA